MKNLIIYGVGLLTMILFVTSCQDDDVIYETPMEDPSQCRNFGYVVQDGQCLCPEDSMFVIQEGDFNRCHSYGPRTKFYAFDDFDCPCFEDIFEVERGSVNSVWVHAYTGRGGGGLHSSISVDPPDSSPGVDSLSVFLPSGDFFGIADLTRREGCFEDFPAEFNHGRFSARIQEDEFMVAHVEYHFKNDYIFLCSDTLWAYPRR